MSEVLNASELIGHMVPSKIHSMKFMQNESLLRKPVFGLKVSGFMSFLVEYSRYRAL